MKKIKLNSPYGFWRLEDTEGEAVEIPNGIVGIQMDNGLVSFFGGRMLLKVPSHWRAPFPSDNGTNRALPEQQTG